MADGEAVATSTTTVNVPMGRVATVAQVPVGALPGSAARKLELIVNVDGVHANSWSFWSFPRASLLDRAAVPVYSTVKWAGIGRLYPFVQQDPARRAR